MKIVCNTSPIIFLAKVGALHLLESFRIFIPEEVHDELLAKESFERDSIAAFLKSSNVTLAKKTKSLIQSKNLGKGELSVFSLALHHNIMDVFLDDRRARSLARTLGLKTHGTLWIILHAYEKKLITKKRAFELICDLPIHGFRIQEKFFMQVLKRLSQLMIDRGCRCCIVCAAHEITGWN